MTKFYIRDYGLTAQQLDEKYEAKGQHPGYYGQDWRIAVSKVATVAGYWDWVILQLGLEQEELDRDSPYNQTGDSNALQN